MPAKISGHFSALVRAEQGTPPIGNCSIRNSPIRNYFVSAHLLPIHKIVPNRTVPNRDVPPKQTLKILITGLLTGPNFWARQQPCSIIFSIKILLLNQSDPPFAGCGVESFKDFFFETKTKTSKILHVPTEKSRTKEQNLDRNLKDSVF